MTNIQSWVEQKTHETEHLYEQYGTSLEQEHRGEYVAIGFDGQTLLGKRAGEVLHKAIKRFGSGQFGFFRVGHPAFAQWLFMNR